MEVVAALIVGALLFIVFNLLIKSVMEDMEEKKKRGGVCLDDCWTRHGLQIWSRVQSACNGS